MSLLLLFGGALVGAVGLRVGLGTIDLFIKTYVNESWFGWHIHTDDLKSFEPLFVIIFFLLVIKIIKYLSKRKLSLSSGTLIAFGLLMISFGYACLFGSVYFLQGSKISIGWIFSSYFFMAIGELCIIPIVISAIIGLSPGCWRGGMMGIKFMMIGLASYFSDDLGKLISPVSGSPTVENFYRLFFSLMTYTAIFAVAIFVIWRYWRNKISHEMR